MKDSIREQWMETNGWEYSYVPSVALSEIQIDASAREQIRIGDEVDQAYATRLALAYKTGAKFPAVIVVPENGHYVVGDGIHRLTGAKLAGLKAIDAYAVTNAVEARQLELLRRSANAIGSKGFDADQLAIQAVALVHAGWTRTEAAEVMHISESTISKRMRADATVPRAAKATGISGAVIGKMTQESLDALGAIQRDDLLRQATEIAVKGKLTSEVVRQMSNEAKRVVSNEGAEALLAEWRAVYADELSRVVSREPISAMAKIRSAPKARLDKAVTRLKGIVTFCKNNIDGRALDAKSRRYAGETIRWAVSELSGVEKAVTSGRSPLSDSRSARRIARSR